MDPITPFEVQLGVTVLTALALLIPPFVNWSGLPGWYFLFYACYVAANVTICFAMRAK